MHKVCLIMVVCACTIYNKIHEIFFFNMTNLIMIIPSKFCQVQVLFFMSKNCFELQNRFDIVLLVALIKSSESL